MPQMGRLHGRGCWDNERGDAEREERGRSAGASSLGPVAVRSTADSPAVAWRNPAPTGRRPSRSAGSSTRPARRPPIPGRNRSPTARSPPGSAGSSTRPAQRPPNPARNRSSILRRPPGSAQPPTRPTQRPPNPGRNRSPTWRWPSRSAQPPTRPFQRPPWPGGIPRRPGDGRRGPIKRRPSIRRRFRPTRKLLSSDFGGRRHPEKIRPTADGLPSAPRGNRAAFSACPSAPRGNRAALSACPSAPRQKRAGSFHVARPSGLVPGNRPQPPRSRAPESIRSRRPAVPPSAISPG